MADPLDLLTLVEAKNAINYDTSKSTHDSELAQWITAVSHRIDDMDLCGPVVVRTVTDETHDGGRHKIRLHHSPIDSVTSVSEWANTTETSLTEETNASKPSDAFLVGGEGRYDRWIARRSGNSDMKFEDGRNNVVVTYEAGRYADTASVDAKFKTAAGMILRRMWSREAGAWARAGDPFGEGGLPGFFKVIDPMIREFLTNELTPPPMPDV